MPDTTEQQAVTVAQEWPASAIGALTGYQRQIDSDGTFVGVSRQALDEVIAWAEANRLVSVSSASAEDFVLVPREATTAMLEAGGDCYGDSMTSDVWDAMLAASPEPVPATNQAGEVEEAPAYDFTMSGDLETVEAEPRAIEKDPFDWPGATGLFMGLFERRDQSEFKMHSGLWDADGMSQNWPEVPNLRNRAALATQPATSQEGEAISKADALAVVDRCTPAAAGGAFSHTNSMRCIADDIRKGIDALVATPTPPTLSAQDLQAAWDRVDSLPPIEFKQDEADEILAALALAQVKAS